MLNCHKIKCVCISKEPRKAVGYESIIYEKQDGVAKITLNRPQALNAFTPEMNRELQQILKDADEDKDTRCYEDDAQHRDYDDDNFCVTDV